MDLKTYIATSRRGAAARLAAALAISPSYLSQMAAGKSPISPERAVDIEHATNGAVARRDLFPGNWQKIWPELAQAIGASVAHGGPVAQGTNGETDVGSTVGAGS